MVYKKLCPYPLAWLAVSLAQGCRAVGYVEPWVLMVDIQNVENRYIVSKTKTRVDSLTPRYHIVSDIFINIIGSGHLLSTKPLPEPMLTYYCQNIEILIPDNKLGNVLSAKWQPFLFGPQWVKPDLPIIPQNPVQTASSIYTGMALILGGHFCWHKLSHWNNAISHSNLMASTT